MKLKQRPNDFRVDELLREDVLLERGEHRVYRVTKRKKTSLEAARDLGDLAGVPPGDVSMAGLKDRQGVTCQFMSIYKGRPVRHTDSLLKIEPVGFSEQELSSGDTIGNAFEIVVRDLGGREQDRIRASLPAVREYGLPNYFDEQRFGNLRHNQGWIALDLLHGQFEHGLKRLLTAISDHDHKGAKAFKSALYRHWGDWRSCRDIAGRFGQHHSVFEHLRRNPDDFAGAFRHVASRVRLIHLYAFQSHLWNRALALHLETFCGERDYFTVRSREGKLIFPKEQIPLPEWWGGDLPLPGEVLAGVEASDQGELFAEILHRIGITPEDLAIVDVPGFQLKPEPRPAVVVPRELRVRPAEPDPDNPGRHLVRFAFQLPRGSYATLVVRRLVGPSNSSSHPRLGRRRGRGSRRGGHGGGTRNHRSPKPRP